MHAVGDEGVSVTSASGDEVLQVMTLDTALASPGKPTPFPNVDIQPDMKQGLAFNLFNNLWVRAPAAAVGCTCAVPWAEGTSAPLQGPLHPWPRHPSPSSCPLPL